MVFEKDSFPKKNEADYVQSNEEEYRNIIKHAPIGIYEMDFYGTRFRYVNNRFCQVLGYSEEELLAMNPLDLLSDDCRRVMQDKIEKALTGNQRDEFFSSAEFEAKTKNGKSVWGLLHSKVKFKDGKPDGVLVFIQDITERKKAEIALEENKGRLQNILNAMNDGIVLIGLDGKVMDCNEAAPRQLGLTREEIMGKNITDFIVPEDKQNSKVECAAKAHETGKALTQVRALRKDSSVFFAEVSITAFYDKNKKPVAFLGVARDITERKKIEDAFRKNQEELQTILDSSQGWIFYKDCENRFVRVNKAFAEVMGLHREQLEGRSIFELYPKEQAESFWRDDKQVIASGKPKIGIIETMLSKKGFYWVQTDKIPYYDIQGKIIGVIGFSVDITEQKEMQAKLQEYTNSLEKLVEERTKQLKEKERLAAIGATAGMVGHDIRNPLQAMISDIYLLKSDLSLMPDGKMKDSVKESFDDIEKNILYVNKIVADLQDYARPLKPEYANVDILRSYN